MVYKIKIVNDIFSSYEIEKRYSEFVSLHEKLKKDHQKLPKLPSGPLILRKVLFWQRRQGETSEATGRAGKVLECAFEVAQLEAHRRNRRFYRFEGERVNLWCA